ncbi:MAG: aminoglycoside phosphotransferase family protein [Synechococcus sp.]
MSNFDWVYEFLQVPASWDHTVKQGYYNTNYIVEHDGTKYVVRVPNPDAVVVDEMHLDESEVLKCLEELNFNAPRLIYEGKGFAVHQFMDGIVLEDAYTRPEPLPDWVPAKMARQMASIHQLDVKLSAKSKQPSITIDSVKQHILDLYDRFFAEFEDLFRDLSFPPRESLIPNSIHGEYVNTDMVFAHCDAHRKNTIFSGRKELILIDWELAKFVPLEYDIASHLYKIGYIQRQEEIFLTKYWEAFGEQIGSQSLSEKINAFIDLETIKSVIVDTARYWTHLKRKNSKKDTVKLIKSLEIKYANANRVWSKANLFGEQFKGISVNAIRDRYLARI